MNDETTTLTDWLLEQIEDDVAEALRLCPGRSADNGHWRTDSLLLGSVLATDSRAAAFIARHDPARVLATCAAHRAIIEAHGDINSECRICADENYNFESFPCDTVRVLASIYAERPGYRDEWSS